MTELRDRLRGLWLPLVTPFRDGVLDEVSLRRLVRHYASGPVDGFILGATSGEGLMLATDELEHLVRCRSQRACRDAAASCRSASASPAPARNGCRRCWTRPRPGRSTAI